MSLFCHYDGPGDGDGSLASGESHPQCIEFDAQFRVGTLPADYSVRGGYLCYRDKYYVPVDDDLHCAILEYFHSSPIGGHGGVLKTLTGVTEFVKFFLICHSTKSSTGKPLGLMQPLPIPTKPWEEVSMDFIVSLPSSHGYKAIMVVVDKYTKGAHFVALKPKFTARIVADHFIFFSTFWRGIMAHSGTKLHYSTTYHP